MGADIPIVNLLSKFSFIYRYLKKPNFPERAVDPQRADLLLRAVLALAQAGEVDAVELLVLVEARRCGRRP